MQQFPESQIYFHQGWPQDVWLHRHDGLEFNLVVRGRGRVIVDDEVYVLRPNHALWLFPNHAHSLCDCDDDFSLWVYVLADSRREELASSSGIAPFAGSSAPGDCFSHVAEGDARFLDRLLADLYAHRQDQNYLEVGLSYATRMAWERTQRGVTLTPQSPLHPSVQQAVTLLQGDSAPTSLEALAGRCGLSPSRLSRLFTSQVGQSLALYRSRLRLERYFQARKSFPDETLLASAFRSGFGSYAQFHRICLQITGHPPSYWEDFGNKGANRHV